jgi:hypothetical protein|tara:strand:+ start:52 stop:441 length:390 start_codon:yes stop_codon:yes gene_type:complete
MSINTRLQQFKIQNKNTSKSILSAYYQVDRATFNKWLILFCIDTFEDENELKKRRKFTDLEVKRITEKLGITPQSFWKKDLIRIIGTDYKTLLANIQAFPSIYNICEQEYRSLSKFPPKVAKHIIFCMG